MPNRAAYNNNNDILMVVGGALALLALLLAVLWFSFHPYLSWVAIKCAWISLPIIENAHFYLSSFGIPQSVSTFLIPQEVIEEMPSLKYWLPRTDPSQVKFDQFIDLLELFGYCIRIFVPLVAVVAVIYVWKRSKAARLSRVMNIFTLARTTMTEFPQIRPAIIEDLIKVDPDKGYFRREESPIRFAIKNNLLKAYKIDFKERLLPEIITPTFDKTEAKQDGFEYVLDNYSKGISKLHNRCILDIKKTEEIFIKQLGTPWTGSENLPPLIKGLYAALIAFACGDKDTSFGLLDQFNRSWTPPRKKKSVASFDVSGSNSLIKKYESTDRIQEIITSHAYVTTVMARALEAAREKGRLGTSLFVWLKVVDRVLWYSLNQEGGQCGWTEAAGPRAHRIAERQVKGPIYKPYVETAVTEFELYLREREGWLPLNEDLPKIQDFAK
jgi:intracellular multiplication protein IcmP